MPGKQFNNVIIIGAGFSGLSAACYLAKAGYRVTILEKHDQVGGRARTWATDGFKFDMGPSWYWMPEVMEQFFNDFGHKTSDFFELTRLSPSYRVVFSKDEHWDIPIHLPQIQALFEKEEKGAGKKLQQFLNEARYKYETAMQDFILKPSLSVSEYINLKSLFAAARLNIVGSFYSHIKKYFTSPRLLQLLEFPILFLGGTAHQIPAMYSMMNYADMQLGTWYPQGGFGSLAEGMKEVAIGNGVKISLNTTVEKILVDNHQAYGVRTKDGQTVMADIIVAGCDYHFTENQLLPPSFRNYTDKYWNNRTMAPSCLIFYLGIQKKLTGLLHHTLFFENTFKQHASNIYDTPQWPNDPLFYVCCPSKTDHSVAPPGCENLFVLIPVAPGLQDTDTVRQHYYNYILGKLEKHCNTTFRDSVVVCRTYAYTDFIEDYHAFKGNAYGLANTLSQTAFLKPSIKNKKLHNLYYTGQMSVPGPGVPPSIISGKIVAQHIKKSNRKVYEDTI